MIEVRTKDVIILSLVVPVAAAALYFHFWRSASSARLTAIEREISALVEEEDFDFEMAKARRGVEAARAERDAQKSMPSPVSRVKADVAQSEAERMRAISEVFLASSLRIIRCERVISDKTVAAALSSTGLRQKIAARCWELEGGYDDVLKALEKIDSEEKAALPVSVSFVSPSRVSITIVF
jgi:hypothetical protein